jgi:hypothetical protein
MMLRITALILVLAGACTADTPTATLHLDNPMDMATVCLSATGDVQPMSECSGGKGSLKSFVITAERGRVAILNLRKRQFEDSSVFIPGVTAVDTQVRAIATVAALDGSAIYTASATTKSVFRMDTMTYKITEHQLIGRPVSLAITESEIIVAVPDAGALARIAINDFGNDSGVQMLALPGGSPYDLALTQEGTIAYVGHAHAPWLSVVDLDLGQELQQIAFAEIPSQTESPPETITLPEGSVLPACINGVDDDGDGLKDFPLDPDCLSNIHASEFTDLPQFMARVSLSSDQELVYVLNVRDRVMAVIDTLSLTRVNVHAEGMPGANPLYRHLGFKDIVLTGVPIDVAFATANVLDDAGETQARARAYVASATGEVHVIDVEGADGQRLHRFRDADDDDQSRPLAPKLFIGTEAVTLSSNRRNDLPSFGEYVTNKAVDSANPDAGVTNYGIQIVGDQYTALFETWTVEHEGIIVERLAKLGALDTESNEFVTPEALFCTQGVKPGDRLVVRLAYDLSCENFEGRAFAWSIDTVSQNRIGLVEGSGVVYEAAKNGESKVGDSVDDMNATCFGEATAYEIRAPHGVYTVTGTVSGRQHSLIANPDGSCTENPDADPKYVSRLNQWTLKEGAALDITHCPPTDEQASELYEGEYFENHALKMRMIPGCEFNEETGQVTLTENPAGLRWRFTMDSAWVPRRVGGMGTPRSLRWIRSEGVVYVVYSGQEKIVEIETSSDKIRSTIF